MSKRQAGPALYEKMRARVSSGEPEIATDVVADSGGDRVPAWLQPGHAVRIPMGYVFMALAVVLLTLVGSYMIGHRRGESKARAEADKYLLQDGNGGERPLDPLAVSPAITANQGNVRPSDVTARPPDQPTDGSRRWGAVTSDPRQRGWNYFVLSETNPDGAVRVAEFCRSKGLETYVVAGNTAKLRKVIALPGFESSQRSSSAVKALEERIHQIGDQWQAQERGARNFRDAYPALHGG